MMAQWAKDTDLHDFPTQMWSGEMIAAAKAYDKKACRALIKEGGNIEFLLAYGAMEGSIEICEFAYKLGARDINQMLRIAVRPFDERVCNVPRINIGRFALKWGATNIRECLELAIEHKLIAMTRALAKADEKIAQAVAQDFARDGGADCDFIARFLPELEWTMASVHDPDCKLGWACNHAAIKKQLNKLLIKCARSCDKIEIMRGLLELGADKVDKMLREAINSHLYEAEDSWDSSKYLDAICELANEYGCDIEEMLLIGVRVGGDYSIDSFAQKCGARDYDALLLFATSRNAGDIMMRAVAWGATDFDGMLASALASGHKWMAKKAVKYGADITIAVPQSLLMFDERHAWMMNPLNSCRAEEITAHMDIRGDIIKFARAHGMDDVV